MQNPGEQDKTKISAPPARKHPPRENPATLRKKTAKAVGKNLLKALLVLVCIGAVLLALFAVSVSRYLVESTASDDLVLDLDTLSVPQTSYILAQNGAGEWVEYQKLSDISNSIWVPLDGISPYMKDAVISTEDRDFEQHNGFNLSRTLYAALNEVFHFQPTFGASTIDQQLVKNLTGEKEVVGDDGALDGYRRKIREIYRAWSLNQSYSKDMILEAYLNTMPLSGTIAGVQAGAVEYFGKDAADLTLAESAMITGITQNPSKYNPYTQPEACKARRDDVLAFMLDNGAITRQQFDQAVATPIQLYDGPSQADTTAEETGVMSYFSDTVFEAVVGDLVAKEVVPTREAAVNLFYNGGLQIYSTVDMELQAAMEQVYERGYEEGGLFPAGVFVEEGGGTLHPQSAMAVTNYSGALVGVVGGVGEKTQSLGLNRATQSPRSVGSTMKPLTAYALGIDYGIVDYSRLIDDSYVTNREGDPSGPVNWPVNYEGEPSGQSVPVADAVAKSLNTVPVRIGTWVGIPTMYEFLEDTLRVTTLVSEGAQNDLGYSSLVLGGMTQGITAAELANAYAIFGGNEGYGVVNTLHCYERVVDSKGNVLLEPDLASVQAISAESAYVVNRLLSSVLRASGPTSGTATGMALETSDSVGKTGTTSDDKDRWFVGLTPQYVAAVWWGYDDNHTLEWPASAQTNPPPNVWRAVMDQVQAGTGQTEFPQRPGGVTEARFCRDSGMLAGAGCGNTQVGYYTPDNVPETCPGHGDLGEA